MYYTIFIICNKKSINKYFGTLIACNWAKYIMKGLDMATEILSTAPQTSNQAVVNLTASSLKSTDSVQSEEGGGDFLSMILSAISENSDDAKSLLPNIGDLSDIDTETLSALPDDISDLELSEATFVQILQLLEAANGEESTKLISKFDDKLKSILQNETVLEEFKNAKDIKDVLDLSKKYNLGLEDIKITSQDVKKLENTFPTLAKKGFFKQTNTQISSETILKNSNKQTKTSDEKPTTLSSLLKSVNIDKNRVDEKIKTKNTTNTDTKKVEISIPTSQNLAKGEAQNSDTHAKTNLNTNANKTELTSDKSVNTNEETSQNNKEDSNKQNSNNTGFAKEISKANNLQVKSSSLRQTLNTFAQDFKEQVEQYKPPVMKVQMSLNPKSLGEMEVTLVNRGNNLQVNITSNTNAMNIFLQNQAEFKNSLVNMGFTNLQMNFSDQRQGQQQGQNGTKFASGNSEEDFEEYATEETVLEITLPDYV